MLMLRTRGHVSRNCPAVRTGPAGIQRRSRYELDRRFSFSNQSFIRVRLHLGSRGLQLLLELYAGNPRRSK